jgi:hypothetical protein
LGWMDGKAHETVFSPRKAPPRHSTHTRRHTLPPPLPVTLAACLPRPRPDVLPRRRPTRPPLPFPTAIRSRPPPAASRARSPRPGRAASPHRHVSAAPVPPAAPAPVPAVPRPCAGLPQVRRAQQNLLCLVCLLAQFHLPLLR